MASLFVAVVNQDIALLIGENSVQTLWTHLAHWFSEPSSSRAASGVRLHSQHASSQIPFLNPEW